MIIIRIPSKQIDDIWKVVVKDIQQALEYSGNYTDADFVYETVKKDKMQLWVIWDSSKDIHNQYYGVVVSEIIERKLKKSCSLFIVTGRQRRRWQHLIEKIEDFAIDNDCNNMELLARKGWKKILDQYDYKDTHIVLEKTLTKKEK